MLEGGANREVMGSYNTGSSTVCDIKKQKDQLQLFLASGGGPFQVTDIKRAKISQDVGEKTKKLPMGTSVSVGTV